MPPSVLYSAALAQHAEELSWEAEHVRGAIHHSEGLLGLIPIKHLAKQCNGIRSHMITPAIRHDLDDRCCNQNIQSTGHSVTSGDPKNEFAECEIQTTDYLNLNLIVRSMEYTRLFVMYFLKKLSDC